MYYICGNQLNSMELFPQNTWHMKMIEYNHFCP